MKHYLIKSTKNLPVAEPDINWRGFCKGFKSCLPIELWVGERLGDRSLLLSFFDWLFDVGLRFNFAVSSAIYNQFTVIKIDKRKLVKIAE